MRRPPCTVAHPRTLQGFLPGHLYIIPRNEPGRALRGVETGRRVHCKVKCTGRCLRFSQACICGFIAGFIAARNVPRPGQNARQCTRQCAMQGLRRPERAVIDLERASRMRMGWRVSHRLARIRATARLPGSTRVKQRERSMEYRTLPHGRDLPPCPRAACRLRRAL